MEKIKFMSEEMNEEVDFYVLEQTKVGGVSYILVTDSEDDDAECLSKSPSVMVITPFEN